MSRRRVRTTSATSSMYGLSQSISNQSLNALAQHRRREGPEGLAILDLQVQRLLHRRRARITQDRAVAERARAELHPPLEPSERLALRPGLPRRSRSARRRRARRTSRPQLSRRASISSCAELGPEVGAAHPVAIDRVPLAAPAACGSPPARRPTHRRRRPPRAGCRSVRTGRRAEPCRSRRSSAQLRRPGTDCGCRSRGERSRQPQHDLFGDGLQRGGQVHVTLGQQLVRLARRAAEQRRRTCRWSWSGRCSSRSTTVEPERPVRLDVDRCSKILSAYFGSP